MGPGHQAAGQRATAPRDPLRWCPATRLRVRLVRDGGPAGHGVYRCHGRGRSSSGGITRMAPDDAGPAGDAIAAALDSLGLTYQKAEPGGYLLRLEGQHKL